MSRGLGNNKTRMQDNNNTYFSDTMCEGMDRIQLASNGIRWWEFVNPKINYLRFSWWWAR
jgi:hypothetical protein